MLGFGESAQKAPEAAPEVAATGSETPAENVSAPAESVQNTEEGAEGALTNPEAVEPAEPGLEASVEEQVDAIFADLEVLVHGGTDEMKSQQGALLSAKVKIKRLLA